MLTIFTTAKPFRGHTAIIQRNALQSWKALHPGIEIILFGEDEGAAEAAREFGLRHEARVERNAWGSKRLDFMFARTQAIARHETLCYINCDIILMADFRRAVERVRAMHREFLMVGRRWDTEITEALPFTRPDGGVTEWAAEVREIALRRGRKCAAEWIDYFVFSRGLYGADMPPFVLRVFWDNWLVWKALDQGKPVIDASRAVMAVHQNHDYSYHPQGKAGVWSGEEAGLNGQMAGGWRHLRTIADATEVLPAEKRKRNLPRHWSAVKRYARQAGRVLRNDVWHRIWFAMLDWTRPVRRSLKETLRHSPRQ
jgi:hypothetical protein